MDEVSRERYIYHYDEQTPVNSINFIGRAIKYYRYTPAEIQTDNGIEFTFTVKQINTPF